MFLSAIRSWRKLLARAAPITLRPRDACTRSSCDLAPLRRHGSVLLRFCRLLVHGAARQCRGPNDPSGLPSFLYVRDATRPNDRGSDHAVQGEALTTDSKCHAGCVHPACVMSRKPITGVARERSRSSSVRSDAPAVPDRRKSRNRSR